MNVVAFFPIISEQSGLPRHSLSFHKFFFDLSPFGRRSWGIGMAEVKPPTTTLPKADPSWGWPKGGEMEKETIEIAATKRGFAAMWERGGRRSSGGSAIIITGRKGEKRRPVYVPRGGHLSCGNHALITVHEGYYFVCAGMVHGVRSSASIWRIVKVSVKDIDGERWEAKAEVEEVNTFSNDKWNKPLDERFVPAVEAAFRKADDYHCRSAYFVDRTEKKGTLSEIDKRRREDQMRRQEEERSNLRQAKADREARAKAEAEAASKVAKEAGLGARLEAVNIRLAPLHKSALPVELGDFSFEWGDTYLYTEENVSFVEKRVSQLEKERAEAERFRAACEKFWPIFESFKSRIEGINSRLEYIPGEGVRIIIGERYYVEYSFSEEGIEKFVEFLEKHEKGE